MISNCTCKHEVQDKFYGKGRRVFNSAPGKSRAFPNRYRCTVCGKEKNVEKGSEV